MDHELSISPGGRLVFEHNGEGASAPEDREKTLAEQPWTAAFGESTAAGLLALASQHDGSQLGSIGGYWRAFARRLMSAICGLGVTAPADWNKLPPLSDAEFAELAASAPPMRGLEYLDASLLRRFWSDLAAHVAQCAAAWIGGATAFLQNVDSKFHPVGKVTFHLAENKREPHRPFAFLATYTHRVSDRAKVVHLPLAEALKEYAGARDAVKLKALLTPVERAAQVSGLVREMLESKALFAPQAWSIRQAYRFLKEAVQMEEAGVVVRLPDWWSIRQPPRPRVQVRLGQRSPTGAGLEGILDFNIAVTLDGQELTDEERRQYLEATDGLAFLRGKWVEVDAERLQQALEHWQTVQGEHENGVDFIRGMRLLAGAGLTSEDAAADATADWSRIVAGDWLRQALERMHSPAAEQGCQPGQDLRANLRPYQVEGVRWLWFMTELGLGGCLADDMGLGKTIQVLDLLLQRRRAAGATKAGPTLLVAPATLLSNWREELTRFAPKLKLRVLHRSECDAETLARIATDPAGELAEFDLVATTYGLVRRQPWLAEVRWPLVVLDEAQAIKNAGAVQTRNVKALRAKVRIALTGTPVENHLGDLWSLFDFVCPGLLGSAAEFKKYIKRLDSRGEPRAYANLRRLVRPYILRRLKTDPDVVPDLPAKTELRAECGLSKKQAVMYERAVDDLARRLKQADGIARRGLVLAMLMQLKQICNHPSQYLQSEAYAPEESGKFERLRLLCEPIIERQERALVFTQFQSLTEPLAAHLATIFGRSGLVLHGGTPVKRRGELVRAFQADDGPPFFVISLKAGGSGLNLTAASHVIHFDRWWNPAVEDQATDRAFRIGQKRNVLVHKFVCRGTVEERIDSMIVSKRALADQILGTGGETETKLTELPDDELLRFVSLDINRALDED